MPLFLAGIVVGGGAVGAVFMGILATASRLTPPGRRGQVLSFWLTGSKSLARSRRARNGQISDRELGLLAAEPRGYAWG
jgi:hypothetical protein